MFQLLDAAGFDVVPTNSAEEALSVAVSMKAELIVSDVVMPNLDGIELCRRLKADQATADVPILLVTALRYNDSGIIEGLEAGADDYIEARAPKGLLLKKAEMLVTNYRKAQIYKRAQIELAESEEKYRTVLDNADAGYYEIDLDGNFIFFNRALCNILQYPPNELAGMNNWLCRDGGISDIYNSENRNQDRAMWYEDEVVRKDGATRFVEIKKD